MTVLAEKKLYRVRFDISVPDGVDIYEDIDVVLYGALDSKDVVIESAPDVEEL